MKLQLALLWLGTILLGVVYLITRYRNSVEKRHQDIANELGIDDELSAHKSRPKDSGAEWRERRRKRLEEFKKKKPDNAATEDSPESKSSRFKNFKLRPVGAKAKSAVTKPVLTSSSDSNGKSSHKRENLEPSLPGSEVDADSANPMEAQEHIADGTPLTTQAEQDSAKQRHDHINILPANKTAKLDMDKRDEMLQNDFQSATDHIEDNIKVEPSMALEPSLNIDDDYADRAHHSTHKGSAPQQSTAASNHRASGSDDDSMADLQNQDAHRPRTSAAGSAKKDQDDPLFKQSASPSVNAESRDATRLVSRIAKPQRPNTQDLSQDHRVDEAHTESATQSKGSEQHQMHDRKYGQEQQKSRLKGQDNDQHNGQQQAKVGTRISIDDKLSSAEDDQADNAAFDLDDIPTLDTPSVQAEIPTVLDDDGVPLLNPIKSSTTSTDATSVDAEVKTSQHHVDKQVNKQVNTDQLDSSARDLSAADDDNRNSNQQSLSSNLERSKTAHSVVADSETVNSEKQEKARYTITANIQHDAKQASDNETIKESADAPTTALMHKGDVDDDSAQSYNSSAKSHVDNRVDDLQPPLLSTSNKVANATNLIEDQATDPAATIQKGQASSESHSMDPAGESVVQGAESLVEAADAEPAITLHVEHQPESSTAGDAQITMAKESGNEYKVGLIGKLKGLGDRLKMGYRSDEAADQADAVTADRTGDHTRHHVGDQRADLSSQQTSANVSGATTKARQAAASPSVAEIPASPSFGGDVPGFTNLSETHYWAKLSGGGSLSRDVLLAMCQRGMPKLSMDMVIYGQRETDSEWSDITQESETNRFGDCVITLQLCNQYENASEADLMDFAEYINDLADATSKEATLMAEPADAARQARRLVEFRNYYDTYYVIKILATEEPFNGQLIDRVARQVGMDIGNNGHFARTKPVGKSRVTVYSLANLSESGEFDFDQMTAFTTNGVCFFLNLGQNRSPGAAFTEMVDTAKSFASRTKGAMELQGYGDSQDAIEEVRHLIETRCKEMKALGVTPGGEAARTLF